MDGENYAQVTDEQVAAQKLLNNQIKKLRNQCFMCESVECFTRIYTEDFGFDEVACRNHAKALYLHANQAVDKSRNPVYQTGTMLKQREAETENAVI